MRRLIAVTALALLLAACGTDEEAGGDTFAPAGADETTTTGPATSIPVRQAAAQGDGPATVTGQLLVPADGGPMLLCAGLTRSIPPLCAGSRLTVEDLDLGTVELTEAAGVRWSPGTVTLRGEMLGDTLFGASVAG